MNGEDNMMKNKKHYTFLWIIIFMILTCSSNFQFVAGNDDTQIYEFDYSTDEGVYKNDTCNYYISEVIAPTKMIIDKNYVITVEIQSHNTSNQIEMLRAIPCSPAMCAPYSISEQKEIIIDANGISKHTLNISIPSEYSIFIKNNNTFPIQIHIKHIDGYNITTYSYVTVPINLYKPDYFALTITVILVIVIVTSAVVIVKKSKR